MYDLRMVPLGYQQMTTALASAVGLASIPAGANVAILQAETHAVRYTDDGKTTPTTTVGMLLNTTDPPYVYMGNLAAMEVIASAGGAILNISYYKLVG